MNVRRARAHLSANLDEVGKLEQLIVDDDVEQPLPRAKQGTDGLLRTIRLTR